MKKVGLLLCLVVAFSTFSVSAQESSVPGRLATFESNGFWDNWFLGAGAGASMYVGSRLDKNADILDRLTVNPNFMLGKWFNPYLGVRLAAQGGKIHTYRGDNAETQYSMTHVNVHGDFLFNWTNYLCKYDNNRFYNFITAVGAGVDRRKAEREGYFSKGFSGNSFNGLTVNASLLNTFRLSNRVSAFAEVGGFFVEKRFDKRDRPKGTHWNGILTASAGLMVKLGKTGFNEFAGVDQGLIDDLNGQINRLRAENSQLAKRPVSCPDCPPVVAPVAPAADIVVPNVVFFRLNSANIDRNQEINIYNTAQYLIANPSGKVKIVGYADKQTGTADYNLKLSERRAKNVAKTLIEKYNINSSRVTVEWKGSSEQPYKENDWNRVAIFFAE